eukprot:scaffold35715_cov24-Tisochrysis_lutea.AAC.1
MAENLEAQAAAVALDERHEDAPKCHLMDACDSLLLQAILLQLDSAADLAHVQCTCKALHRAAQDPALWGALCEKDFGLKLQVWKGCSERSCKWKSSGLRNQQQLRPHGEP